MAYNHCLPNIVDLSGALFTLQIQYMFEHTQSQCEEGAKEVNDIWHAMITW